MKFFQDAVDVYFKMFGDRAFSVSSVFCEFTIGDKLFTIKWYGVIIAFGFLLAVLFGGRIAYTWKINLDKMIDVLISGTILGVIGARAYYVIFAWDNYKAHFWDVFKIWEGGLAIYGGIIGGVIGAYIACKVRKMNFWNLLDLVGMSLLIGQGIGRWGNFANQEAFGTNTDMPWGMWSEKIATSLARDSATLAERGIAVDPAGYVHPTFLYESVWCLLGFVLVPAVIYYVSYYPYGAARGIASGGPGMLFHWDYLELVLKNQSYMFSYHRGVHSTHPYSSVWWQWVLDIRPILYYLRYPRNGFHVSFAAWVNPLLCWGGLMAMLCMAWHALRWRDGTAAFILVGYLAQLLPWTLVTRVVFEYHYFPSTVFLLLALCHVFRSMELRHPRWKLYLGGFTLASLGLFLLFYPALRGLPVTQGFGKNFLKWLPTWPL